MYLDPTRVNVQSCHAVMDHLRGKILAANVTSFTRGPWRPLLHVPVDSLPALLRARLVCEDERATSINGLCIPIDNRALVCLGVPWSVDPRPRHDCTIPELVDTVQGAMGQDVKVLPLAATDHDGWDLFVVSHRLRWLQHDTLASRWSNPLPPLQTLLDHNWPCIADML